MSNTIDKGSTGEILQKLPQIVSVIFASVQCTKNGQQMKRSFWFYEKFSVAYSQLIIIWCNKVRDTKILKQPVRQAERTD